MRTNLYLQEQRKQSFLCLAKENQPPLGIHWNPPTFFFTNPRFAIGVLFCSLLCASIRHFSLQLMHTLHPTSATLLWMCVQQLVEARDYGLYIFKYGYYSYKTALIPFRRPLLTPLSHVMQFFMMDECTLLDFKISKPIYSIIKLGRARTFFNTTPIFVLGELSV